MKATERKNYQSELYTVAKNAKDALIARWEESDPESKYFCDNDTMKKKGVLPEGIGSTAMLLLLAAFGEESEVFSAEDRAKVNEMVNVSLRNLDAWTKGGYVATPLLSAAATKKVFTADYGYTDTVTWCLPSAILARYAERNGTVTLDEDVRDYVMESIAKGIDTLCRSQKDGMWGFRTDTDSPRSLYFTYSAAAAIADFYDYVLGEIALLDLDADASEEEQERAILEAADEELISYINEKFGYKVRQMVGDARAALQNWLIRDALPLFPKVASCAPMSKEALGALGMWEHDTVSVSAKDDEEKVFHHLYYAFYLLDMMVTSGTDVRFEEMLENVDEMRKLAAYYEEKERMNDTDLYYFFYDREFLEEDIKNGEYHYGELFNKNVECALYAARSQYAVASKTGADFWNNAELPLTLAHPDKTVNSAVTNAKDFKDPSVIAMALRSNITYSYYVTKTQDIAVERLFDDMCNDLFTASYRDSLLPSEDDERYDEKKDEYDEKVENCLLNLWDCNNYSLALTERSIEALVDFKDYLDRFCVEKVVVAESAPAGSTAAVAAPVAAKSPFEVAIEQKIEEYLRSEAGKAIIAEAAGKMVAAAPVAVPAVAPASADLDRESLADKILEFVSDIQRFKKTNPDGTEDEKLATALVLLLRELENLDVKDALSAWYSKDSEIKSKAKIYDDRKKKLFEAVSKDLDDPNSNFATLYDNLKVLIDRM